LHFSSRLLNENSTKWLYQRRTDELRKQFEESTDIEKEWQNIKGIISKAAYESLGKINPRHKRKFIKIWDEEIKRNIEKKQLIKHGLIQNRLKIK
jgi:hypothetical protein